MKENGRKPNSACHQEHVQVLNSLTDTLKDELKRGLTLLDNCVNQLAQAKWILINVERTIEDFYADCPACDVKSKTGNSAVTPPSASGAPANSSSTPALNSSSTTQSSSGGARKSTGGSKAAKKASVLPMVSGHTVQRPKINIARVDSNKSKKSKQRTERDTVSASRVRSRGSGSSALATITASASAGIPIDDSADELAAGPSQSAAEPGTSQTPQRKKNKPGPLSKTRVATSNSGGETAGKRDFSCDGADISVDLDDIGYLLSGKTFFKGSELDKFPQIILEAAPADSSSQPETAESKTKIKSNTPTTESAKKRKLTLSSDSDEEPLENLKKKSATASSTKTAMKVATPEAGSSNATASPKVPLKPKLPSALFAKLGQSLLTKLKTGTAKLPGKLPSTPAPPSESGSANKDDENKALSVKREVVKHEKEDNDKNKNTKDDDNSDSASDSNSKTKANDSKKLPNKSSDESEAEVIPSKIDRRTKPADRHKIQNSNKNENDSDDESGTEVLPSKNRGGATVNKKGGGGVRGKKTNKGKSSDDSDDPEFIVSPSKKSRSRSSAGPKSKQQLQPSASSKIKSRATASSGDESNDSDNDSNTSSRQRNKSGAKKSTKAAVTSRVNSSSKSLEVENENDSKSNSKSSPVIESVEKEADKETPVDLEDDNKSSASVDPAPVPARPKPGPASGKAKRTGGRPGPMSAKLKMQEQNDSSAIDVDGSDNGKDGDKVTTTNSIVISTKIFTDSDSDSSELAKIKKKIPLDLQDAVRSPSPNRPNSSDIFGKLLGTYKSTTDTAKADTQAPSTPLQNLKVKVGRKTSNEIFQLEERVREKLSSVGRELVPYTGPIEMSDDFSPGNYYVVGKHNEETLVFCDESSELQELDLSSGDIDELMNND